MKYMIFMILLPAVFGDCPEPEAPVVCEGPDLMCTPPPTPDGCPVASWCMDIDPYASCSARAFCPTHCPEDSMMCYGGMDPDGCPNPEVCATMETSDSACQGVGCPVFCGPHEITCHGGVDGEG